MQPNKNKIIRPTKSTLLIILSGMTSQNMIDMMYCTWSKTYDFAFFILTSLAARWRIFKSRNMLLKVM